METKEQKGFGGKIGRNITIILLVFFGFWIGWDSGAYSYIKYLTYLREKQGEPWMNEYIKILKEQEEANRNDFVGGNTPEEAIDLFVAALKKGDYELAVKYFVIQEQEKQRESYMNLNEENKKNINDWITEIESNKKTWKKENIEEGKIEFWYNTGKGENERTSSIYLRKNINNKWKINHF